MCRAALACGNTLGPLFFSGTGLAHGGHLPIERVGTDRDRTRSLPGLYSRASHRQDSQTIGSRWIGAIKVREIGFTQRFGVIVIAITPGNSLAMQTARG